jgi:hypothetical protein
LVDRLLIRTATAGQAGTGNPADNSHQMHRSKRSGKPLSGSHWITATNIGRPSADWQGNTHSRYRTGSGLSSECDYALANRRSGLPHFAGSGGRAAKAMTEDELVRPSRLKRVA